MNYLNLDNTKTEKTAYELNMLLADYQLYYQKLRNFHWNIRGRNFFELHEKFEELYNDARVKIDELAERILTLRFNPVSNYSEYLKLSSIEEAPTDLQDTEMITMLLRDHAQLLERMRMIISRADEAKDEGTIDMMGGYIKDLEKVSWMLDAWRIKTKEEIGSPVF